VRRDTLLKIQQEAQERWAEQKVFEVEAPEEADPDNKYFANFPYPYMNGLLHLGHAFTISKVSTWSWSGSSKVKRASCTFALSVG
jgi:leucyl-tRNA synthetase